MQTKQKKEEKKNNEQCYRVHDVVVDGVVRSINVIRHQFQPRGTSASRNSTSLLLLTSPQILK